jgi:hypothetical protein
MVDESKAELIQPVVERQLDVRSDPEQERLRRDYDKEALLGRGLFRCASERESRGFPFTDTRRVPKDLLSAIGTVPNETQLTAEDVNRAKMASYGIALELAAQVSEAPLLRNGRVRDEPDSLEALAAGLRKGSGLGKEYLQSNPNIVIEQAREAVARRLNKPVSEVQLGDQQLISWVNEQFGKANVRLGKSAQALRDYFGR